MWTYNYTNELMHHGVLGMKWGRRKARSKRTVDASYKKAHSKTKVKYMSDSELREVNNRLNAEKQYRDLTKRKSRGKKAVNAFIATAATITAVTNAYGVYKKLGGNILKTIGSMSI